MGVFNIGGGGGFNVTGLELPNPPCLHPTRLSYASLGKLSPKRLCVGISGCATMKDIGDDGHLPSLLKDALGPRGPRPKP